MKESDLMHAGSVGKTFFAARALQLIGEGRLAFDDRISKYLGKDPCLAKLPNANDITVRMLMNHTSGLGPFGESFMQALVESPAKERSPLEAVNSISGTK